MYTEIFIECNVGIDYIMHPFFDVGFQHKQTHLLHLDIVRNVEKMLSIIAAGAVISIARPIAN